MNDGVKGRWLEYMMRQLEPVRQNDPTKAFVQWYPAAPNVYLQLGQALVGNTHLQRLQLRDSVMSETDAQALALGICQSKLSDVLIRNAIQMIPSDQPPTRIWQVLYQGIQASQTLKILIFQPLPIDAVVALGDALPLMLSLRNLCVDGLILTNPGAQALARGIGQSKLKSLRVREPFRQRQRESQENRGVQDLFARELMNHAPLAHLKLHDCKINDLGVGGLARYLQQSSLIRCVKLPANDIGPEGALLLFRTIQGLPLVQELDLSENTKIGYEGLRIIGTNLPNQQLTNINLHRCVPWTTLHANPSSDVAKAAERMRNLAGQALLEGIKHNIHIKVLHLCYNNLPPDVLNDIYFWTSLNRTGRHLLSEHHTGLASTVWCYILAKCGSHHQHGASALFFYLSEQPSLVQPTGFW